MAYVSVSEWRPEQVTEWLKGLDVSVTPYLHWFSNNEVNGQQLLNLSPDDLTHLGVHKIGHQEIILQAVEHLRNFHYELDRENLQLLALRVSCAAHSLYNMIKYKEETTSVPTQTMADVSNVVNHVKPLVLWLDRPPFSGQVEYDDYKSQLLRISLEMATCAQRDTFAERPISEIRNCSSKLAKLADSIIQDIKDPMLLQPASLDLATIKKRVGEDLGFFLIPSFHGIHQISDMKLSSPAHQSGKIQPGDEIVQVNYQTVVGWSRKKVLALFDESPNDLLLTLKRRPRHVKMYGQIYMKPYRLPSRKRASPYSRWNDNVPSPRPELLALPNFDIPRLVPTSEKLKKNEDVLSEPSGTSSSSDEEFGHVSDSQNSVSLRLYLPKPRAPIQRRFTLSGPPRPSAQSEQFWRELQLERSWRSNQNNSQINNSNSEKLGKDESDINEMFQLRDKSASLGNTIATSPPRPSTCINFTKAKIGSVKFDLPKPEQTLPSSSGDKVISEERDKTGAGDSEQKQTSAASSSSPFQNQRHEGNGASAENVQDSESAVMSVGSKLMTISELNKIKRDAFFNNMEFSGGSATAKTGPAEDSSEKVKRIIENFKSEVNTIKMEISEPDIIHTPGKVLQLIGSFERKEVQNNSKFKPDNRDLARGKETTTGPVQPDQLKEKTQEKCQSESEVNRVEADDGTKAKLPDKPRLSLERPDEENHGQMVNTINEHLLPNCDFYGAADDKLEDRDDDDDVSNGSEFDYKPRLSGEIVDTVSLALMELKQRQDHYDVRDKQKEATVARTEDPHPTPGDRTDSDVIKPIPTQRKTKPPPLESPQRVCAGPLPPKPLPRTTDKLSDLSVKPPVKSRTPPEPPPRPESTFSKVPPSRRNCPKSSVDGDVKGNVVVLPPMSAAPIAPVTITVTSVDNKSYEPKQVPSPHLPFKDPLHRDRGPSPVLSIVTEKPKTSGGTLDSLRAMLSLGRKPSNFNSPRSVRKKNTLLARKRNVSVKDVSLCDTSGVLWHRNRKGTAIAPWSKFFFVLQGPNFYGFKSKDSQKADLFIHLPGFTCTPAEEVKSKDFAFKIYHTGTAFYFAASSPEDLQQWLDCVSLATICPDEKQAPETVTFSVSDSDSSDPELEPETCFPTSPKMKKFLGASPVPKPARSHQNLASESKKTYDIQKRFGSLKKLSSQKNSSANQGLRAGQDSGSSSTSEIASLDRKYLRFLGHKNNPVPVPTSQFRSYRRMQPTVTGIVHGKTSEKNEHVSKNVQPGNNRDQPGLVRKTLHLSNPSLIHPDMADYRITQERLAEFRRLRNQDTTNEASGGFMTLEQFMSSRQDEDAIMRANRTRPPELRGFMTLEQFLLRQEEERQLSNHRPTRPMRDKSEAGHEANSQLEDEMRRSNVAMIPRAHPRAGPSHSPSTSSSSSPSVKDSHSQPKKVDTPAVKPKTASVIAKHMKFKGVRKRESSPIATATAITPSITLGPSYECGECSCGTCESASLHTRAAAAAAAGKHSSDEDDAKISKCSHLTRDPTPDYPGLEYPPAFEPETYTLQYMLKSRRKRTANKNKNEESNS